MSIALSTERAGGVVIVLVAGEQRLGEQFGISSSITKLLANGDTKLTLDCSDLGYVHNQSVFIGELVSAHSTAKRQGGTLTIAALSRKVVEELTRIKLANILHLFPNQAAAIRSFQ